MVVNEADTTFLKDSIVDVQYVMVSPLCRAMQTAVLAWLAALLETNAADAQTPTFVVSAFLREKVKSKSDIPSRPVEQCLNSAFEYFENKNNAKLEPARQSYENHKTKIKNDITASYQTGDDCTSGLQFVNAVYDLHWYLAQFFGNKEAVTKFFIVAHSGLARFAFSHLLPGPEPEAGLTPFTAGGRKVFPLENCGNVQDMFL